jgi:hypothetical protein
MKNLKEAFNINIFILDLEHERNAQYHIDKHVVKMVLESAQILSTVCHKNGLEAPYRATHKQHPCVLWAEKSIQNYNWLLKFAKELCKEYTYRYKKNHKSEGVIKWLTANKPELPDSKLTEFVQVVPDKYISDNVVTAYRSYYIGEKSEIASWKNRVVPKWWIGGKGGN